MTEFVANFGPLVGVIIGAAVSFFATFTVQRHQLRIRDETRREDAYLEFLDALDTYHLALLDYWTQASLYYVDHVPDAKESAFEAIDNLKDTRHQHSRNRYQEIGGRSG